MFRKFLVAVTALSLSACAATDDAPDATPTTETPISTLDGDKKLPESIERDTDTAAKPVEYAPIRFNLSDRDAEPTATERANCEAAGGSVQRAGLLGAYHCVQEYPDAGKACRDSSECVGQCRADSHNDVGNQNVIGACQKVDVPFGCFGIVDNGAVGAMLCVD